MGGKALSIPSIRLSAARYHALEREVIATLHQAFPERRIEPVLAYGSKPNFGDMDLLIEGGNGYDPQTFARALNATELVVNGDVSSIGLALDDGLFQVDLIETPAPTFDFCSRYFSFNDMGNLMGRIAHRSGAKFGHRGLLYRLHDPDNPGQVIAELTITLDFSVALGLLGYDPARYEAMRKASMTGQGGFQTLHDIFRFVLTSPYVNRDIYLLENVNHVARIRDAKRPTYNAFLAWLDEQAPDSIPAYPWAQAGTPAWAEQRQAFLDTAFATCPDFKAAYAHTLAQLAREKTIKRRYNGQLAAQLTGFCGKALGALMISVRKEFADDAAFAAFFLDASDDAIQACYLRHAAIVNSANMVNPA